MKLLFTNEWLRKRIEDEPDELSCEASNDLADPAFFCPRCNGQTRIDGCYLMCDHCKMVVGGKLPEITQTE